MLSQSITVKIIKKVFKSFPESAVYRIFTAIAGFFSGLYNNSFLKKYTESKPFFNGLWEKSFLAKIADRIFDFISRVIIGAGDTAKKICSGSAIGALCDKLSKKITYHCFLGLVFGLVFLIYSDWWNNLYAAAAAIVLTSILIYIKRGKEIAPSKMDFFMVLFLVSIALGIFAAQSKTDAVRIALIAISALLFHFCTVTTLDTDKKLSNFTKILCTAIFITAIVAICQRIAGVEVDPEYVDLANNEGMPGRVFATMENPNNYAELLILFMPFMLAIFVNEIKLSKKVLWFFMTAVTFVALAMTYSRSCYVALMLAVIIFLLVYDYHLLIPLLIAAAFAVPFLPETIYNRILTIGSLSDSSNSYRLYIWEVCTRLAGNYGLSGLGLGPVSFRSYYRPIAYQNAIKAPHSHMLYLELILEYGIVGFIGFMGYYIRLIRNAFSSVKAASKQQKAYLGAGLGALVGICFVCLAEYIWFYPRDMFAHLIVMGMLAAQIKIITAR